MLAVFLYQRYVAPRAPSSPQWAWNKPGALPQNVPADAYLTGLADAAHEWFNQRPDEAASLARRMGEFRQGCSVLILSDHASLPPEDRRWLVERCRDWAAKLDKQLAALENGADVLQVRSEMDDLIAQLSRALRSDLPTGERGL
jgi:hypothetical protein